MARYRIYIGKRHQYLPFYTEKEFDHYEQAEQFAFDAALDKLFPYETVADSEHANMYLNALDQIDYYIEEM